MKQLTRKEKKRIIRKVNTDGKSVGDIAKEYGRSRRTIDRIVKRGSLDRASKVDKDVKKEIMRLVTEKPGITSEEIQTLLKVKISTSSVNKCLARSGFVCQSTKVPVRERTRDAMRLPEKKEKSANNGEVHRREYKLDDKTREEIMNLVAENPRITANMIQTGIGKHIAISTINGFLSKNGLKSACRKIPNRGKESIVTPSCRLNEDM